jgi:hypothetical protein
VYLQIKIYIILGGIKMTTDQITLLSSQLNIANKILTDDTTVTTDVATLNAMTTLDASSLSIFQDFLTGQIESNGVAHNATITSILNALTLAIDLPFLKFYLSQQIARSGSIEDITTFVTNNLATPITLVNQNTNDSFMYYNCLATDAILTKNSNLIKQTLDTISALKAS